MTFGKYADRVLAAARLPIRPITRLMKRGLVRQIIDQQLAAGRLEYFRNIAATAGLVDMVCEFISELKRLEIWPEEFQHACGGRGLQDKDRNLAEVYHLYQQALRENRLFDEEGRFWSARDILQRAVGQETGKGKSTPTAKVPSILLHPSLVVVDGFTDFTRTQHEILDILACCAEEMWFALPLEAASTRPDLFAKPLKTREELQRRHPVARIEEVPRASNNASWPAMARLEQDIFQNPRRVGQADEKSASPTSRSPSPGSFGLEIFAAAKQIGEIRLVAQRIKRLLVDGNARPGEIAVVFRSPLTFASLVEEVFSQFGIPFVLESGPSLAHSPAIRALLALLQLDVEDWPFHRLLGVVGSNYFRPQGLDWESDCRAEVEQILRGLQIPGGRLRWLAEVRGSNCPAATAVIQSLVDALEQLPERATLAEWAEAWQRLAVFTGLKAAMAGSSCSIDRPDLVESDHRSWNRLVEALEEETALTNWLHQAPAELDRQAAFAALFDIVNSDRPGHAGEESGYVRVLSATSVRSLRIPHLFVAGLSEKAFPPPDREDRIYSEGDCLRLIEAGLPLVARQERMRDEMLLFYEVVTRATKRLYLSYPALDDAAQELLPSPFLAEIEQAFASDPIRRTEQNDLSPIPRGDHPLCQVDFRVQAMATALDGNVALLAGLFQSEKHQAQPLAAGLEVVYQRQERGAFGPTEGMLETTTIDSYLQLRYPLQHAFAATDLERYASCPFRFLVERVLKLRAVEDLELEFDILQRGSAVHDVLAEFHRTVNRRLGRPGTPLELDAQEAATLLDQTIQRHFAEKPHNSLKAAMYEIDRRLVTEWLSAYLEQAAKYGEHWAGFDSPMAATLFEVSFGRTDGEPNSVGSPLEFERQGRTYRIAGRIDRIDTGVFAGHNVFNVLDYKTGRSTRLSAENIRQGTTLQLPLYALAASELLLNENDSIPWQAGYWYVRDSGFKVRQSLQMYRNIDGRIELEPLWEELRSELGDIVATLVENIRRGCFPVCSLDDQCTGYCPFSTVCRINQVRSLEKTWQATAND